MKKLLFIALVLALVVSSCKKDDDGDDRTCNTCQLEILGTATITEICDNGDGTISVTQDGQTQTTDLNGVTYAQYIAAFEQAGGSCN